MNTANKHNEIRLDDRLEDLLEDLRCEHRSIQPPAALDKTILEKIKLEPTPPRKLPLYAWSLALAAAVIAIAIILLYPRPSRPTIETRTAPLLPPKSIQTPSPLNISVQPIHPDHHSRRPVTRHQSSPGLFVPLPNGVGLPEPAQAMLIRTRIDTSSLRSYGLTPPPPGAPQTILAEFLVGEDGLPRAIRLVQ